MGSAPWSNEEYSAAIAILGSGRFTRLADALPDIASAIGRSVAIRSLYGAFEAGGHPMPGEFLVKPEGSKHPGQFSRGRQPERRVGAERSAEKIGRDERYEPRVVAHEARAATSTPDVSLTKILVIPDMHHPYADDLVWRTILAVAREAKPDIVVIIGDFCDFYSVSFHAKDPARGARLRAEIDYCNDALNELQQTGVRRVVFVEGNHENRLARWVAERAPELFRMMTVQDLLGIEKRGWEWVPYKSWITIGKMSYTHDVERCGINAGRQSLIDFGGNLTFGHSHRGSTTYQGTLDDGQHVCLNVGHGSDYDKVDYRNRARAKRDWQHGFGWQVQTSNGDTWCQFVPILDGRCIVDGQLICGRGS